MTSPALHSETNGHPANGHSPHGHASNGHPVTGHSNGHNAPMPSGPSLAAVPLSSTRTATLDDIVRLLNAELVGDGKTLITGVAGLDAAVPGTISFVEHERLLKAAMASDASALIAPSQLAAKVRRAGRKSKPIILTGNPRLAFARVMEYMSPQVLPEPGVHSTAVVESDAYIAPDATVREGCYVGHHAHIGSGTVLYPHVVLGDGAQIGDGCTLYPSVVIQHHVHIGNRVRIHSGTVIGGDGFGYVPDEQGKHIKVPQVGNVIIEDDVEIGANVCIDRATMGATRIGSGTKIDNLVQIAHNVQVGRNCIICGQVGLSGSVTVGDGVIMAGQAGLADHVKVGSNAVLGAKAGIMADVPEGEFVLGSPAQPTREFMKTQASLRKLPESLRQLRALEKQLNELKKQIEAGE